MSTANSATANPIAHRTPRGWARLLARLTLGGLCACMATACGDYMHVIYGYMDAQGQWAVLPVYDDAFPFSEGLAAVKQDGHWGYIDRRGRWVIPPTYESATSFAEGRAGVKDGEHWIYIDPTGAVVIAGPYDDVHPFAGGLAAVQTGDKWGFIDHSGRQVVAPKFDEVGDDDATRNGGHYLPCFSEGLCAASTSDAWGYVDRRGEWVVEPRFAQAGRFMEGLAGVREHAEPGLGKVGFVDRTGAMIIPARYTDALWFSGGRAIAVVERDPRPQANGAASNDPPRSVVMIDRTGREIADVGWNGLEDSMDLVAGYLEMSALDYLADGLVPASQDTRWGYMDRHGQWLIAPQFGLALPFRNGRAVVMVLNELEGLFDDDDARAGIIDTSGRWLVRPELTGVGGASPDQIVAALHERWGVLNGDGQWTIEPRYREIDGNSGLLPETNLDAGSGLRRVGVTANHEWVIADPRGHVRGRRECEWLETVDVGVSQHSSLLACAEGEAWGLTDLSLRPVVEPEFQDPPRRLDGFLAVKRRSQKGCIDDAGRVIVPIEFQDLARCAREDAIVRRDRAWGTWDPVRGWQPWEAGKPGSPGFCDGNDEACTSVGADAVWQREGSQYVLILGYRAVQGIAPADEIRDAVATGTNFNDATWIAHVRRGALWGVVDEHGHEWLPARYDEIGRAHDGMVAARTGERWQILDSKQRVVFAESALELAPFTRKVAIFREGQNYGLITRDGRVITPAQHHSIKPMTRHEATFQTSIHEDAEKARPAGVLDDTGRLRLPAEYVDIREFSDTLWKAQGTDLRWNLIERSSGRRLAISDRIVTMPGDVVDGLSATQLKRSDGRTALGYLDAGGRIAIEPQYAANYASNFAHGVAVVWRDDLCGAIDRRGRTLLPLQYLHCEDVGNGLIIAARHVPWRDVRKPVSP